MTTSQLGRTKAVVWPDFQEAAGSGQVTTIQNAVTEMSNNANNRFKQFTTENDSTTVEVDHNLGVNLNQLTVLIYTGSGTSLTRVQDPEGLAASLKWTIAEKAGFEKTVIEVTTPSSGQPHTFAVILIHDVAKDYKTTIDQISVTSDITLRDKILHRVDTSAARTLTLPAANVRLYLELKDITGSASTNNITINTPGAETIDGAASFAMDSDYMGVAIISDGTNYFVI